MPTLHEIKTLTGRLSSRHVVSGTLQNRLSLSANLNKNGRFLHYFGPYEVYPTDYEQRLPTEDKVMDDNVLVHEIPLDLATTEQIDELF